MAALLSPPKRQNVYHGIELPAPEPDYGQPLAPGVNIPADFAREGLEASVNKLSIQDEGPVPFSFPATLPPSSNDPNAATDVVISHSLQEDVLKHP